MRHNHPAVGGDWLLIEKSEYRGALGQLSRRTTRVYRQTLLPWGPSFETSFTYDGLGRVATVDYPRCVASPDGRRLCDDGNDLTAPAHTVSTTYRDALPWRVDSSHGTWAS